MTPPPSASPSTSSSGMMLLLQSRLSSGDCSKWRTVLRFTLEQAQAVQSLAAAAQRIDSAVIWRVRRAPE